MEKVEVVIKIPKYYLTHPQDYTCLAECVRRGTLLPKGHGKIVDIKPLMIGLYEGMGKEAYTAVEIYEMLEEDCRVIIEADEKGAEE